MNILITCAGRRNYLVEFFQAALRDSGHTGRVFAADMSPYAPALYAADGILKVPPIDHPNYLSLLRRLCRDNEISLLVSVNDLELPILARHRQEFAAEGIRVLVATPEFVEVCSDKARTGEFLGSLGLDYARTATSRAEALALLAAGDLQFPLVVKPRFGSASFGVEVAYSLPELEAALTMGEARWLRSELVMMSGGQTPAEGYLIQELVRGQEYGLDVMNDLEGQYVATCVKQKLLMRAGETDRALTVHDQRLEALGEVIARAARPVGVLDCDVIVSGERAVVIDMNPRFGGGYPFSHAAGINMPAAIVAWACQEEPDPAWFRYQPGVAAAKYDRIMRLPSGEAR